MKNNIFKIIKVLFFYFLFFNAYSAEQFNFNVTELEITDNGNKFTGTKKGVVTSDNGVVIEANQFEYDKNLNILNASGNVKVNDTINNYVIYTEKMIYYKEKELIFTKNKSKGISLKDNIVITANDFEYDKSLNIISAKQKVVITDNINDIKIYSEFISYLKDKQKIYTKGVTSAVIHSKYNFESKDVVFFINTMELNSQNNTIVTDNLNLYKLSKFKYLINKEKLLGEEILISSNYNLPKNDKLFFSSAVIDLKKQNFVAKDTEIKIHKSIFDNSDNDPRLKGVTSTKNGNITLINKGIFTSCKKTDSCPPWSIQASEIKHDKDKKQLNYKNALVKLYDVPILYFPKFFHPDPTVKRQSGLLKPVMNESNILGSSFTVPYYHVISNDSDLTFAPSLFDSNLKMFQNEYRKVGKNYDFTANFGHTREYNSSLLDKKKNISYLFSKFAADLDIENFNSSKLTLNIEKVTDDTFLKIFDANLLNETSSLKPKNPNILSSELELILDHENFDLTTGFQSFENLQLANSDRHEFILPYFNFDKNLFPNLKNGSVTFQSNGSNNLNNTNQLKSQVINNINYSSLSYFSSKGIKNNFNVNIKNLNSMGKNISKYKSSPQIELSTILEFNSSIPLKKETKKYLNFITPKLSFKVNPGDMKNYNTDKRSITTENIFSLDRLGLNDSLESGRSLTLGIDYRKEKIKDMNKYFEVKLASVLRDKEESFMPSNTTLNKKTSNIFGTITNNFSENLKIDYDFALDNNLDEIKYNDINANLLVNNFATSFHFIKEVDEMGNENFIENNTSYQIDDNNYFTFNTRRNRKLNLTEFYDLVYEYKNDCLTAAVKYKKSFYEDRDLKPTEDLFFSITLFPLTTFEQKVDNSLYQ